MARLAGQIKGALTSQTKAVLTLLLSVALSVASSVATRRFDQPAGKWIVPACFGAVFLIVLFLLALTKSREELKLAEFERIQSAENERDAVKIENETRTANAVADRIQSAIESGNLEEAERWKNFQKEQYGK